MVKKKDYLDKFDKVSDKVQDISEKDWKFTKYHWEFMRRNPDYIQAYKKDKNTEEEKKICEFFGLSCDTMLDPVLSFEDLLHNEFLTCFGSNRKVFGKVSRKLGLNESIKFKQEIGKEGSEKFLDISINFEKVNSIDTLKNEISNRIDFYWLLYCDKHSPKTIKLTDYDLILQVGDLKEKKGLTHEKIAQKLFPRDFNDDNLNANPESAISKVKQYRKKYLQLVKGGYKEFFPI